MEQDKKTQAQNPQPWEIWLARVKFTDKPWQSKVRPVLVMRADNGDLFAANITSHEPRIDFYGEYAIKKWQEAGLAKQSTLRLSVSWDIEANKLLRKIGDLQEEDITNVTDLIIPTVGEVTGGENK